MPLKYELLRTKEIDTMNDFDNAQRWVKNNFSDNITIGLVGGMGSYATVDFFHRIVDAFPADKEWDRPRVIIDNRCNMPSRVRAILYNERRNELIKSLSESIKMMIDNNTDYIVLVCNTSHVFLNDVYERVPESRGKVIHIIEELAKELKENNVKEVKLYASEGTIQSKIYDSILSEVNIKVNKPKESEYSQMRKWIESVKTCKITEEVLDDFVAKINASENAILGCTELPILYNMCKERINVKVFDPLESTIKCLKKLQEKMQL